jgi:hypothetical protein
MLSTPFGILILVLGVISTQYSFLMGLLVLMRRIELPTSVLPRQRSTTELHQHI